MIANTPKPGYYTVIFTSILCKFKEGHSQMADLIGKLAKEQGAANLFKERFDLPPAFSLHGSFYNWIPEGKMPETTICLGYNVGGFFKEHFAEVKKVRTFYNPYAETEEEQHQHIYICKKPKQTFDELKMLFEEQIFE